MNHKKTLASLLMLFVLAFSVILPAAQPEDAAAADIQVFVNGQYLSTDQPPVIQDGRTMVPLRAIFEALGAQGNILQTPARSPATIHRPTAS